MRIGLLAFTLLILTVTSVNAAAETGCRSVCDYYRCNTVCRQLFTEEEIYERNQYNSERELDYRSPRSSGSRYRLDNSCTRALESGVDYKPR